ncbi:hypothetical protein [uncultured Microbacterium sp.]|uniref:hypothetical protein n=1 Tax=uncultured Microbacterium sp. TaxID=191216 RepID=UPI0025E7E12B|nr:hypothetical protein [uncultured Microbacterium sp.]
MPELAVTLWVAIASGVISVVATAVVILWVKLTRDDRGDLLGDPWLLRAPLLPLVIAVVAGLVAVYALILHFAFGAATFQLPVTANTTSPILVAATLIAGTLTAAYAVLKLRAHLLAEARGKLDANGEVRAGEKHRNDQEAAYSERFAQAVSFLADTRPISRIAGAHLILAIGDEWTSNGAQQRCFDVLLSHLRGLNRDESFEDEAESRSSREEVRLITSGLIRHLADPEDSWKVVAGDFSGAVVADFDLASVSGLLQLDLRGTRVLGDLSIPAAVSVSAPRLSGLICEGDLVVEINTAWHELDLANAEVNGSATVTATGDLKTLNGPLISSHLIVGGDLNLALDLFQADVVLDSATIDGRVVIGSPELGAAFGPSGAPSLLSAVGASFQEFRLRRASPGPRLDLGDAVGSVDLSGSKFDAEVTANNLDASSGLHIKDASFNSLLVLDGAITPVKIDVDGVVLSDAAVGSISSSEFALRDQLLALSSAAKPDHPFVHDRVFDWRTAIAPFRDSFSSVLLKELDSRLAELEADLPVAWETRPTFAAQVMSIISRVVAKTGASEAVEADLKRALRAAIELAPESQETS